MGKGKVLQDWVGMLSWKKQSAIISSLRGPDNMACPNLTKITRWMRNLTQHNADPNHTYMQIEKFPTLKKIQEELRYTTVHYASHFLYGLEILGYNHPNQNISRKARKIYEELVKDLHLNPETKPQLEKRLRDVV